MRFRLKEQSNEALREGMSILLWILIHPLPTAGISYLQLLQVEKPKRAYGGHHPMRPVANGIIPRNAQGERSPTKAIEIIPRPKSTLMARSVVPIFFFI
jgi:hypothetical protein